jgi:hypothetical protein
VSPYRNAANTWVEPSIETLTFTDGVASSEMTVPNLKLKGYRIAQGTTGGTIEFMENNTQVLRYFLSATQDVQLNHRPAIGGFYDLQFQNNQHNFTVKTNSMEEDSMAVGKKVDLTQDITDFKTLHGITQDFYIYFFSPFVKVDSNNTNFKVKFDLNNNEINDNVIAVKTKEQLEDELQQINSGQEVTTTTVRTTPPTLKEKWDEILAEVKGTSSTPPAIVGSAEKYYSVIRRTLNLKVGKDDAPNVEKVLLIPN